MKNHRQRTSVLVIFTLICALWVAPALAVPNYTITGYTATFQTFDPAGNGLLDTTGYYSISLWGGSGSSTNVGNLQGRLTLFQENADLTRNTVNPTVLYDSGLMLDSFYLNYDQPNEVLTLGSLGVGDMLQLQLSALLPADPASKPALGYTSPLDLLAYSRLYVNQIYGDAGDPASQYSYDPLGNLTNPLALYGSLMATGFLATDAAGNAIDMDIDDASYIATPEPSTFALFGIGLFGFGIWRRRKA